MGVTGLPLVQLVNRCSKKLTKSENSLGVRNTDTLEGGRGKDGASM